MKYRQKRTTQEQGKGAQRAARDLMERIERMGPKVLSFSILCSMNFLKSVILSGQLSVEVVLFMVLVLLRRFVLPE